MALTNSGASNLHNKKAASNFQPMFDAGAAYVSTAEIGINTIEVTLFANTAQVNTVGHSLGKAPSGWSAVQLESVAATRLFGLIVSEASAANNSCIGVFVTGFSITDKVSAPFRFSFLPPSS